MCQPGDNTEQRSGWIGGVCSELLLDWFLGQTPVIAISPVCKKYKITAECSRGWYQKQVEAVTSMIWYDCLSTYWVHGAGTLLGTGGTPGTVVEGFNDVTSLMSVSLQLNVLKNSKYVNKSQIWLVIWGKCLSGGRVKLCLLHPSEKRSRVVFL